MLFPIPEVRAIVDARGKYRNLHNALVQQLVSAYVAKQPSLESFIAFLEWTVCDKEIIQDILVHLEKAPQ